ncbi:MAG: ACT domain-containing protein [Candidatus Eisenbacteria bacterium]|nr:ACT domain-containing protein [Candidatus Eisenbacteria bacterium]
MKKPGTADKGFRIAYQGEPGAWSEVAALRSGGEPWPCPDFAAAFATLTGDECAFAVLPIENSLGGSLHENYDLLAREPVRIVAEGYLPIEHRVLGLPGATLAGARTVHSHPQALAQCSSFFRRHPHLMPVAAYDTAGAAAEVAALGDRDRLAVGSARAGELHGLVELARPVPPDEINITRFLYLAREGRPEPRWAHGEGPRKTSLVFGLQHRPGTLGGVLAAFADRGINLTKIESRPTRRQPFEYLFYVDFEGDESEPEAHAAMRSLRASAVNLKVLGCYRAIRSATH